MNHRSLLQAVIPAMVALTFVGCAKLRPADTVVGTWQTTMAVPGGSGLISTTLNLKADGTVTQSATTSAGTFGYTGTYKIEGEQFTTDVTDMQWNGTSLTPAEMAKIPRESLTVRGTIKQNGDTLTMTEGAKTITMNRAN